MLSDLDPLRERPQMVAPKSAVLSTHAAGSDGVGDTGWKVPGVLDWSTT